MNYLSVCSGIEAATVAWQPLGWEAAGFSEIEPFPCSVLEHHYPDVTNYGDMTKYKEWDLDGESVELVCGGTPCQSFSVAGLRKGLDDPRGNLALVFLGIVDRYKPRWVVWENVPGVLSDKDNAFGQFMAGLVECGYGCAWRILDAQNFGVPQRRRRVFVVGYFGDWRPAAAVLFERESLCRDLTPSRETRTDDSKEISTGLSNGHIARALTAKPQDRYDPNQETYVYHNGKMRRLTALERARLQGFPDDYLDIIHKGKPASDSARYKALGNSMAVPVMRWIGERIQMFEEMCAERAKE